MAVYFIKEFKLKNTITNFRKSCFKLKAGSLKTFLQYDSA